MTLIPYIYIHKRVVQSNKSVHDAFKRTIAYDFLDHPRTVYSLFAQRTSFMIAVHSHQKSQVARSARGTV